MRETITISILKVLKSKLDTITKREHLNRSDIVCDALRKYFATQEFNRLRSIMLPQAEKQNIFTDEDVFNIVS
ncbi:MAG TPA: CopG family transcriptional regulator [bacterium]|nr:CopG family transcriptional regulator [bacterium]